VNAPLGYTGGNRVQECCSVGCVRRAFPAFDRVASEMATLRMPAGATGPPAIAAATGEAKVEIDPGRGAEAG